MTFRTHTHSHGDPRRLTLALKRFVYTLNRLRRQPVLGYFMMSRKMLLGIKERAEQSVVS